jgi:hypothetical protein
MEEFIIREIIRLRDQHYVSALLSPKDKDAFGYGAAVGAAKTFERVLQAIKETLARGEEDIDPHR